MPLNPLCRYWSCYTLTAEHTPLCHSKACVSNSRGEGEWAIDKQQCMIDTLNQILRWEWNMAWMHLSNLLIFRCRMTFFVVRFLNHRWWILETWTWISCHTDTAVHTHTHTINIVMRTHANRLYLLLCCFQGFILEQNKAVSNSIGCETTHQEEHRDRGPMCSFRIYPGNTFMMIG